MQQTCGKAISFCLYSDPKQINTLMLRFRLAHIYIYISLLCLLSAKHKTNWINKNKKKHRNRSLEEWNWAKAIRSKSVLYVRLLLIDADGAKLNNFLAVKCRWKQFRIDLAPFNSVISKARCQAPTVIDCSKSLLCLAFLYVLCCFIYKLRRLIG